MKNRSYQLPQIKCNFCFQWFHVRKDPSSLNICSKCLQIGQTTNSFKIPCPQTQKYYQIVFIPTISNLYQDSRNQALENMENIYINKVTQLLDEWKKTMNFIETKQSWGQQQKQELQKLLQPKNQQLNQKDQDSLNGNQNNSNFLTCRSVPSGKQIWHQTTNDLTLKISSPEKETTSIDLKNILSPSINYFQSSINQLNEADKENIDPNLLEMDQFILDFQFPRFTNKIQKTMASFWAKKNITIKDTYFTNQTQLKNKIYRNLTLYSKLSPVLFRVMTEKIYEAVKDTNTLNSCLELVSHRVTDIDFRCYLQTFNWDFIKILKLVKVGLTDEQFKITLEFLQNKRIETIVATGNLLREQSCLELLKCEIPNLKNVYMSNNMIYQPKVKSQVKSLKEKFMIYL